MKYKLITSYDGTNYSGWQVQDHQVSIQGKIEESLATIIRQKVRVIGSGRTDTGVHALEQTAHFTSENPLSTSKVLRSLNSLLPHDIRILSIEEADPDFHAQYSAHNKTYYYHLHLDPVANPFTYKYRHQVKYPLNLDMLREGAQLFIGTHDFTTFANKAYQGSAARNPVRTIFRIDAIEEEGGVRLEFQGNGFLYKMVRNITGTLLEVARGKLPPTAIPKLLKAKDRQLAPMVAPARGLFLAKVSYD
ncbi:MAG: tRNA pseudouridine(38-40) synthase TruA [Chlamydiota bacterium]